MKNIQRMTTTILTSALLYIAFTAPPNLAAQTTGPSPSFMTGMATTSELYDNRGYQKDKAISTDGRVAVSKTNGNLQYRYDLSSYSAQGFPVTFSLNYNQNASYTSFRSYNSSSNVWEQMKQNRPAWILGVNGFAVQALTSTERPLLAPAMRTNTGTYTNRDFNDDDVIWMLDGYDYCNRMNDISKFPSGQNAYVDVIKLLREDGSVLELYHVEKQYCTGTTPPSVEQRVTGTYISASANSSAYAIVKTDPTLLSSSVLAQLLMRYNGDIPADRLPRRVEYYPGDGLTYVFREWTTPFGIEPYQSKIESVDGGTTHAGDDVAGPTIFYLSGIVHNSREIVSFQYAGHNPTTSNAVSDATQQRGRAMLTGFDSHTLTWGLNDLTIDAIGKKTMIEFKDAIYSGTVEAYIRNLKCAPPQADQAPWSEPSQYFSWTGLVTGIMDPVGRTTTFTYEGTTKEIRKSEYPFVKNNGNASTVPECIPSALPCSRLFLASKRLTAVKELDVRYGIVWKETTSQVIPDPASMASDPMSITNEKQSQIVQDLKKYDVETNTHLTTETYLLNQRLTPSGSNERFRSTITYTDVVGSRTKTERMTTEMVSLGRVSDGWPRVTHSDVTDHEMEAEGIIERTITGFVEVPAWTTGHQHSNIRLPGSIEKTTIIGATTLPRTRQEFTYALRSSPILSYTGGCGGSAGIYGEVVEMFGHAVDKKTELLKVWKSGAWTQDLKTVTEFQHLPVAETTVTIRYWDKHASYAAFLDHARTQSPPWSQEVATEKWNTTDDNSPWMRWWSAETTAVYANPPVFNLTKAVELRDPNSGDAILKRIETDYETNPTVMVSSGLRPNLAFGKQIAQRTYGAGLTNAITTTIGYAATSSWMATEGALPISATDAMGSITAFTYQPLNGSWPTALGVSSSGIVSAKTLYNDHVGAGTATNVDLRGLGARLYEKPTVTERQVRKYLTGGGTLQTQSLASFQTYTHYGLPQDVVDENGFLSRFRYDGIGRLQYAWLPGDFPTASTTYDWHTYDVLDDSRTYDANGYSRSLTAVERQVKCIGDCHAGIEQASSNPMSWWIPMTIARRQADPRPSCPCSAMTPMMGRSQDDGKGGDQVQYINYPIGSTVETILPYRTAVNAFYEGDFVFNRWDHRTVSSAALRVSLAGSTGRCVAFTVTVSTTGVTASKNYILNCYPSPDITQVPVNELDGLVNDNADIDFDLSSFITAITYTTGTSADPASVHVKIEVDEGSFGSIDLSRVRLVLGGSFRTWGQSAERDFTLAFKHTDAGTTRSVVSLAKIDDRATVSYSSLAYSSSTLQSRHAKALSVLTYDDLVKEQRWNYGPLVQNILPLTTTTHGSVSTSTYLGDGLVKKTVDPQGHEVTNTYDDLGRPEQALTSAVNNVWTSPIYNVSATQTGSQVLKTASTYTIVAPSTLGFPSDVEQSFNGYCRYVVTSAGNLAGSGAGMKTAQFFDARDRVVLSVENYTNMTDVANVLNGIGTPAADQNLVTRTTYDIQGRTKQIVSPGGQAIRYWYDNHGRIRYTFQTDQGYTSYAYDKLGRVRFSQTAAQALVNKVAYYQYDDLGRMTAIGEATLATAPPSPMMGQDHGGVTGDRISKGGPTIQALPAMDEAMNLNRWTDRISPDALQTGVSPIPTANQTLLMTPVRVPYALWAANNVARNLICDEMLRTVLSPRFSPMLNPGNQMQVLHHPAYMAAYPTITAPSTTFEHAGTYPEFVLQTTWYDEMPPTVGVAWAARPSDAAWQAITPMPGSTWQGNWKGRPSLTAYRTHGGQPFHYVLRMYDERGRLASMVRYTENVGFDGVYYAYNAMNRIVSVHVVDPSKQHATWYTYDASGRVSSMATRSSDAGYGNGAGSPGPNAVHNIPTMPVLLTPPPTRDISYTYDTRDAVSQTTYTDLGKKTVYTRNKAGWLMENKTTNTSGSTTYHQQRFAYDNLSRITDQYWQNEALNRVETYTYDGASRLNTWMRSLTGAGADYLETYGYDRSGNRVQKARTTAAGTGTDAYAYANAGLYQRANWLTGSTRTTGLARTDANTYTENGGIATRTRSEDLLVNTTPFGRQTYETWSYDANNLVERYTRASVVKNQNLAIGCYPDALTAPRDDWRYRYAPFMEREQKRQVELSSGEYQLEGLAWVYYGLGGDKKQLSVWNGVQGTWCLQNNHVFIWPVEYNSYGPMNTRIITRAAGGTKEIVFTDHLGSTVQVRRGTPEYGADQRAYTAFGEDVNLPNEALMGRTGYIGRETDNESALGFYGVRQYDAGYGRFLSVDPLWNKYTALTPYQYAGNNPVTNYDNNGKEIAGVNSESARYVADQLTSFFDVNFTASSTNVVGISSQDVARARAEFGGDKLTQFNDVMELIGSTTHTVKFQNVNSNENSVSIEIGGLDQSGAPALSITGTFNMPSSMEELFIDNGQRPFESIVLIRPEVARTGTFSGTGGQTAPCESCVMLHELLDHALPWLKLGPNPNRQEGVENHNKALQQKGSPILRDGNDHSSGTLR